MSRCPLSRPWLSVSHGHVGDGNVQLNVLPPAGLSHEEIQGRVYEAKGAINAVPDDFGGSISADHGIGCLKKPDFLSRSPLPQAPLLTAIKRAVDLCLVMNSGCQLNFGPDS